jgi:SAM-dependent methyltransferase
MNDAHQTPLYDTIGVGYDGTRRADPEITRRLAGHLGADDGNRLDLACGTGNYTAALAAHGGTWYGVDQSGLMIERAQRRSDRVVWLQADAAALPFPGGMFTGAICTLATHHFPDLTTAFAEVHRVLQGGRFVIFTATPEQMRSYWLNEYFPVTMSRAIAQMPPLQTTLDALDGAGFRAVRTDPYSVTPELEDLFLYAGKHRPQLYLSPEVRRGISTFATLADPAELARGLRRLESDITSGAIDDVVASYRSDAGDYLFVIAERGE